MNAIEIEEAISQLAEQPFDPVNFSYAFLEAFGNKETTIKRLRAGASNKSDLGGVLQTNNIKVCAGRVKPLQQIGEEVSEENDLIPAKLIRRRTVHPKYACRCGEAGVKCLNWLSSRWALRDR